MGDKWDVANKSLRVDGVPVENLKKIIYKAIFNPAWNRTNVSAAQTIRMTGKYIAL